MNADVGQTNPAIEFRTADRLFTISLDFIRPGTQSAIIRIDYGAPAAGASTAKRRRPLGIASFQSFI